MNNIEMQPVISSQIEGIGYDPSTSTLAVQFKGGTVYHYNNVEPETFAGLKSAESVGSFFGKVIKPYKAKYPFTRQAA